MKRIFILIASIAGLANTALATPIEVTAANIDANAGVQSFTAGGATFVQSQFITGRVTEFAGASNSVLLVPDGASAPPTGSRGLLVGGDFNVETGNINAAVNSTAVEYTFDSMVINNPGPDIALFEIASNLNDRDGFSMTINGTLQQYDGGGASVFGPSLLFTTSSADVLNVNGGASNITALENNTTSLGSVAINQGVYGTAIDLSDFGVAPGAGVTVINYGSRTGFGGNGTFDPVFLVGINAIPEPSAGALVLVGAVLCFSFRRLRIHA